MKTLFTFFISSLLVLSGFAQYGQKQYGQFGETVIINFNSNENSYGNSAFQVVMDGTAYTSANANTNNTWNRNTNNRYSNDDITINNVQPGQHTIQIYRIRNNDRGYGGNNNRNYGDGASPLYSSSFILRQGFDAILSVRGNGQVQFSERQNASYNNNTGRRNHQDRDRDGDRDDRRNGGYNNGGYNNNGGYSNGYPNGEYNRAPMADYQFSQIYQNVRGKWFQSNKVTALKDAFNTTSTYFSTSQISQLLQLITSESNRLQLAEISFRVTSDPQNFTQIYNLFSSQSSRNELDRYIRSNRY